jgi:hypothetical protein
MFYDRIKNHATSAFAIFFLLPCLAGDAIAADSKVQGSPIHQLRIYQINDANRDAFDARFRDHAARIMAKYDFNIIAMWESRTDDRVEFVYLLQWPDEMTMENRRADFMADQEWKDIKQETGRAHGTFVNDIEDRTLLLTSYSPKATLLPQAHLM